VATVSYGKKSVFKAGLKAVSLGWSSTIWQ